MAKPSQIGEVLKVFMEAHGDVDITQLEIINFFYLGKDSKGTKIQMHKAGTKEIVSIELK